MPGSELRLHGVDVNPTRIGVLHVLERMGARLSLYNDTSHYADDPSCIAPVPSNRLSPIWK